MNIIKLIEKAFPEQEISGAFVHFLHQNFDCGSIAMSEEDEYKNIINSAEMIKFLQHKIEINEIIKQCGQQYETIKKG